jgi:hypothetical protein
MALATHTQQSIDFPFFHDFLSSMTRSQNAELVKLPFTPELFAGRG